MYRSVSKVITISRQKIKLKEIFFLQKGKSSSIVLIMKQQFRKFLNILKIFLTYSHWISHNILVKILLKTERIPSCVN